MKEIDFRGMKKEKIRKAIKKREMFSFVVVYNLLLADKFKSEKPV
jgi:hypothetical protein